MKCWSQFENDLGKFLPSGDQEVIRMLRRRFQRTTFEFRNSQKCASELRKCLENINRQPHRVYTILNDLKILLKHQAKTLTNKARSLSPAGLSSDIPTKLVGNSSTVDRPVCTKPNPTTNITDGQCSHNSLVIDIDCSDNDEKEKDENVEHSNGEENKNNGSDSADSDLLILNSPKPAESPGQPQSSKPSTSEEQFDKTSVHPKTSCANHALDRKRALITRLERLLSRISDAIKKLEEQELDLDELESADSAYVQLDVLKRRYLEVWRRLCEARRVARISGRILRRRFTYSGCRYATVNTMIEELVNDKKRFPDMVDIRNIVALVNKNENLQLSSTAVTEMARHIFVDVGHLLKRRRQQDLLHDFGCYLTDDLREEDDPTYSDPSLRRRLAENRHLGEVKLNSVFDKFVRLQQCAPVEIDDSDEAETITKATDQSISTKSPIPVKKSRIESESTDSESLDSELHETPTQCASVEIDDSDEAEATAKATDQSISTKSPIPVKKSRIESESTDSESLDSEVHETPTQCAPVEIDDSDEAEATAKTTEQSIGTKSPILVNKSRIESESTDSESLDSEVHETPTHEVVMLSSDSDASMDAHSSPITTIHKEPVSTDHTAADESIVVVPDDPPAEPLIPIKSYHPSNNVPSDEIINLTDDDDDDYKDAPIMSLDIVPVNTAHSLTPYSSCPLLVSPPITGHFSQLHPGIPPTARRIQMETSRIFQSSSLYPIVQETQSVTTMTRQCSVNGVEGHQVHTSFYKQATTTSRVLCPPVLASQHLGLMPSNICVASFRTLSAGLPQFPVIPSFNAFVPQTIHTHQNADRNAPRDSSNPIILD